MPGYIKTLFTMNRSGDDEDNGYIIPLLTIIKHIISYASESEISVMFYI